MHIFDKVKLNPARDKTKRIIEAMPMPIKNAREKNSERLYFSSFFELKRKRTHIPITSNDTSEIINCISLSLR
jgi:hypothetical protein